MNQPPDAGCWEQGDAIDALGLGLVISVIRIRKAAGTISTPPNKTTKQMSIKALI
jgi:hypothetical protein